MYIQVLGDSGVTICCLTFRLGNDSPFTPPFNILSHSEAGSNYILRYIDSLFTKGPSEG